MNPIWPAYVILSKNGIYYTLYQSLPQYLLVSDDAKLYVHRI